MDITLLSKMLKELILVHDEVSLPGLGSFVANLVPAGFSDRGLTVNPPYRRLSFIQKDASDTLLAQMYADGNGISVDLAQVIIEKTVSGLSAELYGKKLVVLPGLGRLRSTRENSIFFVPEENLDIYPEGTGLEPVSLRAHKEFAEMPAEQAEVSADIETTDAESVTDSVESGSVTPVATVKPGRRWWLIFLIIAAVVALAVGIFLLLCNVSPDLIDSILYSTDELRIINS